MIAANAGRLEAVNVLLSSPGLKKDAQNDFGHTAVIRAADR